MAREGSASTRPLKRGRPSKRPAVSLPESIDDGASNFYNADTNEYLHLDIDPDIDALEDIVYGNIFPLQPPAFLSEKNRAEYQKRIRRMSLFSRPCLPHPTTLTFHLHLLRYGLNT